MQLWLILLLVVVVIAVVKMSRIKSSGGLCDIGPPLEGMAILVATLIFCLLLYITHLKGCLNQQIGVAAQAAQAAQATEYIPPAYRVLNEKVNVNSSSWDSPTFEFALKWMRETVGWNVSVHWKRLEKFQITKSSEISIDFVNVPVHVALNEIVQQLSSKVTFHLTPHLLIISSQEYFDSKLHLKTYDLSDLIILHAKQADDPLDTDLRKSSSESQATMFGVDEKEDPDLMAKKSIEQVILMIQPDSWNKNGGKGSLYWVGNVLVVANTIEVHELVSGHF